MPRPAPPTESGAAATTRYFDGCKASCSWSSNIAAPLAQGPVTSCGGPMAPGESQPTQSNSDAPNVCAGGGAGSGVAYGCMSESPFTVSSQRYGFAAANLPCCQCYELTFQAPSPVAGETMIVQVTNSGDDLGEKHFDLLIPGGGFGVFNGVTREGGRPPNGDPLFPDDVWGAQEGLWGQRYGGVSAGEDCADLPAPAVTGCQWRFASEGLRGADNPAVTYTRVACPPELYKKSGCLLAEDVQ